MEEKNDIEKIDDVMLPGFRFHPTDEELVGFYLKRKIQQRPLHIELIKQVDIYKYDPWDLPKLATTGEKEWYFYCPRDRKYRNSARPNRVTGAGFWKATGTDRPIYSSDGTKCIGLKKSLVFYRGRAAKGIKTDWMMHEFRLPSLSEPSPPPKKFLDKSLPPNDAWAICRIFKKTSSMAQRALNHSWMSHLPDTTQTDMHILNQAPHSHCVQFSSDNISCTTEIGSVFQINEFQHQQPIQNPDFTSNFMFSPLQNSGHNNAQSMILNSGLIEDVNKASQSVDLEGFSVSLGEEDHIGDGETAGLRKNENSQWGSMRSIGFPFSLGSNITDSWDSPPCPSEISSTYSTDKCYT